MKKIELLAPAGDMERVKMAFIYGADAVYFGGRNYSLRANAKNLSIDEIKEACSYAHNLGKKVYVTVNIVFHDEDTDGLLEYLEKLSEAKVDAIIVSDPLVINLVKKHKIKLPIHLSTQASTVNYEAVMFWKKMGVSRVVLGREASREEIKEIIDKTGIEVEAFIHGAMCASYSGRCVLSNYFTNRDANRGGCAQICRWDFSLSEDNKVLDNPVKFTMCSKDLCMLEYIPDMIDMGIASLKIEGRMRSIYYIAMVVNNYRRMIDEYYAGILTEERIKYYRERLNQVANRDNTPQFYNKFPGKDEQYFLGRNEESKQDFLALIESQHDGIVTAISKNYFKTGDMVEVISPDREIFSFKMPEIYDEEGNLIDVSNHPEERIKFKLEKEVKSMDMIRVKK